MTDRKAKGLVVMTAIILLLFGFVLYFVFDKQGMNKHGGSNYVNYDVNDYIEVTPVIFSEYSDVYSNINVSKITLKNIDDKLYSDFIENEEILIEYITGYYNEIKSSDVYESVNIVNSTIKAQVNDTVLSILYRMDFNLDKTHFNDNVKSYVISYNIDLGTNKVINNSDLLSKYNYSKNYIANKLFNEDILINKGQVVIDKNSNISLTKNDIERKKDEYLERIIDEFDNIIVMYIDNKTLVLVYDSRNLKNMFFDNKFDTNIKYKYLQ